MKGIEGAFIALNLSNHPLPFAYFVTGFRSSPFKTPQKECTHTQGKFNGLNVSIYPKDDRRAMNMVLL